MIIKKIINHSLFKNTFFLSLVKALDITLPLMTIPYLTRVLSVNEFGSLIVCMAAYSMANILTDFGFGLSAPYDISRNKHNKKFINSYLTSIFILKFIFILISITILYTYFKFASSLYGVDEYTIILIFGIIFSLAYQAQWFFLGIEKMKSIAILASLGKLSYFVFIFTIVPHYKTVNSVLFCSFISNFIPFIFYLKFIHSEGYRATKVKVSQLIKIFRSSLSFFISRLAVGVSTTANGVVIGSILGVNIAGLYGAAEKIYNAGISLVMPISNVFYPYMARTKNHKLLIKVIIILTLISIVGCIIISNISSWFFIAFFGPEYKESAKIFDLFLILIPINVISIFLGYSAFAIVNKPQIANYTVIFSAILYLFIFFILHLTNNISILNIMLMIIGVDSFTVLTRGILFYKEIKIFKR
ncbi:oligosaccharide flippase family protein [Providencia rettgeri]|uniref:oligosaccharide flippase family protein n=2 Tax=Providencia TaxID=586 RepID=UPI00065E71C0|nr:oligosaccharide flippase family protein [Providencia rettgeri]ELR5177257.1 oligosaccharide flippase family protein [Providencia rettgeri]